MKKQILFLLLSMFLFCAAGQAQTTAFTYQGRFADSTVPQPTNGTYQMQFALFDAGGTPVGAAITVASVQVVSGIFTVELDFGAGSFTGADRFLEIRVFNSATGAYVALSPRQPITSTPYSIRSKDAATAEVATNTLNVGGTPANQIIKEGDTRLSDNRTPIAGSANYIQNQAAAAQTSSNFNISDTGAANIFSARTQFNIGGNRVLSNGGTNGIFVGVNAGRFNTTGNNNSFIGHSAGFFNTTGGYNSFVGVNAGVSNTTGEYNTLVGVQAGFSNTTGSNNVFLGVNAGAGNTTGNFNTVIGINAGVAAGNLTFATAIGAGSTVFSNSTIALGRSDGSDKVVIFGLGSGGSTQLCRNSDNIISTCSSSLRYKINITPFNSGLNLVKRLQPISFDWKSGGLRDLGLGAEDVAAIEPLLATYNKDGQIEGVKYDRIGVVLLNAVKEQQTQIEAQQKQIEAQQLLIDDLKKLVCANNPAAVCQ